MSFATLGCVVPPEGGVEECDAGTDALGVVGVVVEVLKRSGSARMANEACGPMLRSCDPAPKVRTNFPWAGKKRG